MKALAAALALAAPSQVAPLEGEPGYAPAGDRAIYATAEKGVVTLRSLRFAAGTRRVIARITVPPDQEFATPVVAASPSRVGLGIETEDDERYFAYTGVFAGSLDGPLETLRPFTPSASTHRLQLLDEVLGPRIFVTDVNERFFPSRTTVYERTGEPRPARLPRRALVNDFAGTHAAYWRKRQLIVTDWRTGKVERRLRDISFDVIADLRADGAITYARHGRLMVALPGQRLRAIARAPRSSGTAPIWAGRRVVLQRGRHLVVFAPNGRQHRLGPYASDIDGVVADRNHVMWSAHDCILAAAVTAGPAPAPGAGPCHRTELDNEGFTAYRYHGVDRMRVRCIAGPGGVCRGTAQLLEAGAPRSPARRFSVGVQRTGELRFKRHGTGVRVVLREGGRRWTERYGMERYR